MVLENFQISPVVIHSHNCSILFYKILFTFFLTYYVIDLFIMFIALYPSSSTMKTGTLYVLKQYNISPTPKIVPGTE